MACLGTPHPFKFFKGCLPEILLGLSLNTLTQISPVKVFIPLILSSPLLFILYINTNYNKRKTWTSILNFQILHQKNESDSNRISIFFLP